MSVNSADCFVAFPIVGENWVNMATLKCIIQVIVLKKNMLGIILGHLIAHEDFGCLLHHCACHY